MVQFLSSIKPKARKEHKCNYCNTVILVGERYNSDSMLDDSNKPYTWKSHTACQKFADDFKFFDNCDDGLTGDSFRTGVWEIYQHIMSEHFNEQYEAKDFIYPSITDAMKFCYDHKDKLKI